MVNPGDDDEDIYDRVADELEDYGVGASDFEMKMMESNFRHTCKNVWQRRQTG